MLNSAKLEKLALDQLFALALYSEEYNVIFFRGWANRLRPYDAETVSLLGALADDAQEYRDSLYASSKKIFPYGLPELEPELYSGVRLQLDLPDSRFFVVSNHEARLILNTALKLQRDTIELLAKVDEVLQRQNPKNVKWNLTGLPHKVAAGNRRVRVYSRPRVSSLN